MIKSGLYMSNITGECLYVPEFFDVRYFIQVRNQITGKEYWTSTHPLIIQRYIDTKLITFIGEV